MRNLIVVLVAAVAFAQAPSGVDGNWQGTLAAGALNLRLGLHITKTSTGEYKSTLDSIDQGQMGLAVTLTTFSGKVLHVELPNAHIEYDGTLSPDGKEIAGAFTQGAKIPLTFKRVDQVESLNRPQNPRPPFPYDSIDVTYESDTTYQSKAGGITLAGTLTVPRSGGPFPVAIMITGSGPQDRDETLMGHKPFLVIADYLARRGVAVLRLDDRGVGKSTGNSTRATIDDMCGDVLAGINFLRSRKEIDAKHIGVIGHSEGGLVGPLVASRSPEVAFVVMLAGPGVPLDQLLYKQGELVRRSVGAGDEGVAQGRAIQEMLIGILKSEPDEKLAAEKVQAAWTKLKAGRPEAERKQLEAADTTFRAQTATFNGPEYRSTLKADPAATLRNVKAPVLAMNGARDLRYGERAERRRQLRFHSGRVARVESPVSEV